MVVGTKARLGGCMGQTEAWDMTKGVPLALTLMNYEQTNFASDGRGVTVPAFQNQNHNLKSLPHATTKTSCNTFVNFVSSSTDIQLDRKLVPNILKRYAWKRAPQLAQEA